MKNSIGRKKRVFAKTNGRCYYCGCELQFDEFQIDHLIPKSEGGKGGDNLVPSCRDCNMFKGKLGIEDFRKKIDDSIHSSIQGRMIAKYFNISEKSKGFYFDGSGKDGDL